MKERWQTTRSALKESSGKFLQENETANSGKALWRCTIVASLAGKEPPQYYAGMKILRTICVIFAIGIVTSLLYEARHELYRVLAAYKLVPHEEGITELYFEDSDALPERAGALSFSFVIRNLEGQTMVYPYVVYTEHAGQRVELKRDVVSIAAGEHAVIETAFRVGGQSGRIIIELPEQNQRIAFLIS
ncbi:MAG: hypothetical protein AAB908_01775 [Patescibacteria group bacterium]